MPCISTHRVLWCPAALPCCHDTMGRKTKADLAKATATARATAIDCEVASQRCGKPTTWDNALSARKDGEKQRQEVAAATAAAHRTPKGKQQPQPSSKSASCLPTLARTGPIVERKTSAQSAKAANLLCPSSAPMLAFPMLRLRLPAARSRPTFAMQSAPRARRGQHASLPFDSHRFLAGGNGPGRRSGELFGSSRGRAGDNGASSFGDSSAATSNRGPKLLDADEASVRGWPVGCSCSALDCDDAVGTGHAHSLPWIGSRGRDSPSEMKTSVCSCRSRASLFACPSRVETETSLRSSRQRIYASDQDETRDVTVASCVDSVELSSHVCGGALCGFTVSSEETRETSYKFIGAVGWSPPPQISGFACTVSCNRSQADV